TKNNSFDPVAISRDDPNKAYAFANSGGRSALWLVDLTDKDDPILVFADPTVDVDDPVSAADTHLIGVYYETVYPNVFYLDDREQQVAAAVRKAKGGQFTMVEDRTQDENLYVLRSESDVAPDFYTLFDIANKRLTNIGGPQPGLNSEDLPSMQA